MTFETLVVIAIVVLALTGLLVGAARNRRKPGKCSGCDGHCAGCGH